MDFFVIRNKYMIIKLFETYITYFKITLGYTERHKMDNFSFYTVHEEGNFDYVYQRLVQISSSCITFN